MHPGRNSTTFARPTPRRPRPDHSGVHRTEDYNLWPLDSLLARPIHRRFDLCVRLTVWKSQANEASDGWLFLAKFPLISITDDVSDSRPQRSASVAARGILAGKAGDPSAPTGQPVGTMRDYQFEIDGPNQATTGQVVGLIADQAADRRSITIRVLVIRWNYGSWHSPQFC